ncbi:MAG: choice-of-anchor J domain-containing protein, partial [Ignavibacteria bacterium]|nr:choice-of-anchor J domain-containing protein [Ignavibacteria bacterium]
MQNNSYSQRIKWEEKFESLNIENNGWEFINNDSSAVTATFYSSFDFFNISSQSALSGNNFLKYNFVNANYNNLIDDWVITPKLFDISESDTISFWCGA